MKKMEREMEEVFDMKVQEKLQKLKDIEADVSILIIEREKLRSCDFVVHIQCDV